LCSGSPSGSSSESSCPGGWLGSGMSGGSSSSDYDSSSDFPHSSGSSVVSEGGWSCCSTLGDGLHVWLLSGVVPVKELLMKRVCYVMLIAKWLLMFKVTF
jgi:hypothetical protein